MNLWSNKKKIKKSYILKVINFLILRYIFGIFLNFLNLFLFKIVKEDLISCIDVAAYTVK